MPASDTVKRRLPTTRARRNWEPPPWPNRPAPVKPFHREPSKPNPSPKSASDTGYTARAGSAPRGSQAARRVARAAAGDGARPAQEGGASGGAAAVPHPPRLGHALRARDLEAHRAAEVAVVDRDHGQRGRRPPEEGVVVELG